MTELTTWLIQKVIGNQWQTLATLQTEQEARKAKTFPLDFSFRIIESKDVK